MKPKPNPSTTIEQLDAAGSWEMDSDPKRENRYKVTIAGHTNQQFHQVGEGATFDEAAEVALRKVSLVHGHRKAA